MEDKLLEILFERDRWMTALEKAVAKGNVKEATFRRWSDPKNRAVLMYLLHMRAYNVSRPHTAKIPKDNGEFRTVYANEDDDRILFSIINDMFFQLTPDMIHPNSVAYQTGIGCGKVVKDISSQITKYSQNMEIVGWKADLSKYFDSVPIEYIDGAFDELERRFGKSAVIDLVRTYYHSDLYYDSEEKCEKHKYQSLKQGCAVASWLANVILYHIDDKLSQMNILYKRYCDDIIAIGPDYEKAMTVLATGLGKMRMELNPNKVEAIRADKWFKFLGFSIKGDMISLGGNRIKSFEKEIMKRTIDQIRNGITYKQALNSVNNWMYRGNGEFSWATGVLKVINSQQDVNRLNAFVLDCLRAVIVGKPVKKPDIGGLGWVRVNAENGCIDRGKGKKVRTWRIKTGDDLEGYHSVKCMQNALIFSRDLYDTLVRGM